MDPSTGTDNPNSNVYGMFHQITFTGTGGGETSGATYANSLAQFISDSFTANGTNSLSFAHSGGGSTYYGDGQGISVQLKGGSANGNDDTSAIFDHNTFNFAENVNILVGGTTTGDTYYGTIANISAVLTPGTATGAGAASTATFSNNSFNFGGNVTITGGSGNEDFYGNVANFGNTTATAPAGTYNGFYNGNLTVSQNNGFLTIASNDGNHNSITFSNVNMTGGGGNDTFHFTLVAKDQTAYVAPATPNPAVPVTAVFEGFQNILDFSNPNDTIDFKLSQNLYNLLGITATMTTTQLETQLDHAIASVTTTANSAKFNFAGGGALTLSNLASPITDLTQISHLTVHVG
jgi:hypothetical protein